jgi:Plasmid pRiA4b ORF-3-like protein
MIPLPSTVAPELAEAALSCVNLARARKLAGWIGAGRQLTSSGVLKPALAVEACQLLGIELPPGRLRSALDVDELMRDWEVACIAGYIISSASHVRATGRLTDMSPENVLRSWLRAASAELGLPDEPCAGCLTVLHELSEADGALGLAQLAEAVRALEPLPDENLPCPGCGEVHDAPELTALFEDDDDDDDPADSVEHAEGAVVGLIGFGAATALQAAPAVPGTAAGLGDARVRLTPLGRLLAESLFTGCAPAADADAAGLIDVLSIVPPKIAAQMAAPWLAARTPAGAVRELLSYAESADATRRMIAMAFAMGTGTEVAPAWREWAGRPGFGVYARMWLKEQGEEVPEHPGDHAWMTVEALSAASAAIPAELTPLMVGAALAQADAAEAAGALSLMSGSGHPDAARFIESVAAATGLQAPVAPRARPAAIPGGDRYQLKITLRGVSKPPVWRRVTVPAAGTLDFLHDVIQRAMGWEDGHLHMFSTPFKDYGQPGSDLGYADERRATLAEVLGRPGASIRYTYDFGDGWEHDIVLEKILPPGSGTTAPSCLAGKGACPPEDCGGAWGYASLKEVLADPGHDEHEDLLDWLGLDSAAGFDPARFRLDEVNARLGPLT